MSSNEASTVENKNEHESRERPAHSPETTGDDAPADGQSSAWGPDDDRSRDESRGRHQRHVHTERRQPDWGDRRWRRSRRTRGDATDRGRDWGPPAALPDRGTATTYGDDRRRGRRHATDDRRPAGRQRATSTARAGPRAVEFDPVRRWGPDERERSARFRRPVRADDGRERSDRTASNGDHRTMDRSGRDGGRPGRARERAGHRHGSDGAGTGQGRRSF